MRSGLMLEDAWVETAHLEHAAVVECVRVTSWTDVIVTSQ